MRIIKLLDAKGRGSFHEVLRAGPVQFEDRRWLLLSCPPGARPRKPELQWILPTDSRIALDRRFRFALT